MFGTGDTLTDRSQLLVAARGKDGYVSVSMTPTARSRDDVEILARRCWVGHRARRGSRGAGRTGAVCNLWYRTGRAGSYPPPLQAVSAAMPAHILSAYWADVKIRIGSSLDFLKCRSSLRRRGPGRGTQLASGHPPIVSPVLMSRISVPSAFIVKRSRLP